MWPIEAYHEEQSIKSACGTTGISLVSFVYTILVVNQEGMPLPRQKIIMLCYSVSALLEAANKMEDTLDIRQNYAWRQINLYTCNIYLRHSIYLVKPEVFCLRFQEFVLWRSSWHNVRQIEAVLDSRCAPTTERQEQYKEDDGKNLKIDNDHCDTNKSKKLSLYS